MEKSGHLILLWYLLVELVLDILRLYRFVSIPDCNLCFIQKPACSDLFQAFLFQVSSYLMSLISLTYSRLWEQELIYHCRYPAGLSQSANRYGSAGHPTTLISITSTRHIIHHSQCPTKESNKPLVQVFKMFQSRASSWRCLPPILMTGCNDCTCTR
jgi:hypothetical protein